MCEYFDVPTQRPVYELVPQQHNMHSFWGMVVAVVYCKPVGIRRIRGIDALQVRRKGYKVNIVSSVCTKAGAGGGREGLAR